MAPASTAFTDLDTGREAVIAHWAIEPTHAAATRDRMATVIGRFVRRLDVTGVDSWGAVGPNDCAGFVSASTSRGAAPHVVTQHWRRSTLRCAFRTLRLLGVDVGDPTVDLTLPPRTRRPLRALQDDEITLLRVAASVTGAPLRGALVLALAEATATTAEMSRVRVCDLDDPRRPMQVWLPGGRRREPRAAQLSDWGQGVLASTLSGSARPSTRLVDLVGARPAPSQVASNTTYRLLKIVGLDREPDVAAASIRNWAATTLHRQGLGLIEVAQCMGFRSLDATAAAIGHSWNGGDRR